jgi:hypothetical protein
MTVFLPTLGVFANTSSVSSAETSGLWNQRVVNRYPLFATLFLAQKPSTCFEFPQLYKHALTWKTKRASQP